MMTSGLPWELLRSRLFPGDGAQIIGESQGEHENGRNGGNFPGIWTVTRGMFSSGFGNWYVHTYMGTKILMYQNIHNKNNRISNGRTKLERPCSRRIKRSGVAFCQERSTWGPAAAETNHTPVGPRLVPPKLVWVTPGLPLMPLSSTFPLVPLYLLPFPPNISLLSPIHLLPLYSTLIPSNNPSSWSRLVSSISILNLIELNPAL